MLLQVDYLGYFELTSGTSLIDTLGYREKSIVEQLMILIGMPKR